MSNENHLTIYQLAERWGVSREFVRRLMSREPGVLRFGDGAKTTLRIPPDVAARVERRLSVPAQSGSR